MKWRHSIAQGFSPGNPCITKSALPVLRSSGNAGRRRKRATECASPPCDLCADGSNGHQLQPPAMNGATRTTDAQSASDALVRRFVLVLVVVLVLESGHAE